MAELENASPFLPQELLETGSSLWKDAVPKMGVWFGKRPASLCKEKGISPSVQKQPLVMQGSWPGLRNLRQISAYPRPSDEHFNTGTKMENNWRSSYLAILA